MRVEVIPQIEIGNVHRVKVGDVLNKNISQQNCEKFRFAVAYLRTSGLDRLSVSIDTLLNRGGTISGAVGIDDTITSIEALEMLSQVSPTSTVFHTVSQYIYHPKLYLMDFEKSAVAVLGSSNLTRDGLFRNVELATAVHLDFTSSTDLEVYKGYDSFIGELLDSNNSNVQQINLNTIKKLIKTGLIKTEASAPEPGAALLYRKTHKPSAEIGKLFPPLHVPVAPALHNLRLPSRSKETTKRKKLIIPPQTINAIGTFVMQLSKFDSSHKTGVKGTPEVLIPHGAIKYFPALKRSGRKYPDSLFDVVLNTTTGRERHQYRLWYYENRAVGTKIDEYRLRLNHDTIDLTTTSGGDLLIINKLPRGSDPQYEVTILPQTDPTFPAFYQLCTNRVQDKKWGLL